jgi:tetratricopeptide (TPR) repeat protein
MEFAPSAFVAVVVAAGVFVLLKGRASRAQIRAAMKQGRQALKAEDYDLAIACASAILRQGSSSPRAIELRALAYCGKRAYARALADADIAVQHWPQEGDYHRLRGDALTGLKRWEDAIAAYSEAIRLNPDDAEAYQLRAEVYRRQERTAKGRVTDAEGVTERSESGQEEAEEDSRPNDEGDQEVEARPVPSPLAALSPRPVRRPTRRKESRTRTESTGELAFNGAALTGFCLGVASVFLSFIGILPILAVVFSGIGLGTFDEKKHKAKWMPAVGLGLGILFTLVYLSQR